MGFSIRFGCQDRLEGREVQEISKFAGVVVRRPMEDLHP